MGLFRKRSRKATEPRVSEMYRETVRTLLNIIFCIVGLALGIVYLSKGLLVGWVFIAGFTFFLLIQFSDPSDTDI
ncbi:hypothetical protein [Larkinella soli]|uniref:hypothetical protein n=1 Tax=Larkinella soli TaxID=1770527 RepID=UPI000FFBF1CB|nr:hypothetical protein [Larkinella soli]